MARSAVVATIIAMHFSPILTAQVKQLSVVQGQVFNKTTKTPVYDVTVSIPSLSLTASTNGEGNYTLNEVPYGNYTIVYSGAAIQTYTMALTVAADRTNIEDVYVSTLEKAPAPDNTEIPTISIEDNISNQDDDGSASAGSGGLFMGGQDPFMNAMTYTFGQYYFRPRGISDNELQVNGIVIDDLERGFSTWSHLGGLNDVLHGRNLTWGLQPSAYTFGGNTGSTFIDATAADQRAGNTVTYTRYNRNYNNRLMFTHNSGLKNNNWAWSVSGSRRWAEEGYTPGTFFDAYSFYAGASKVMGKGMLNVTVMGAPTKRGRALNATEETYQLAGSNQYNAAWGYQNGEKRNSRIAQSFQPIMIANYVYRPNHKTRWNTALGAEGGKYKSSTIDFYNAYSPRPDYYRNLPSYYYTMTPPQNALGNAVKEQLLANPDQLQINWDNLYAANYMNTETVVDVNGIAGNNVTGKRAMYVLSNYVNDMRKLTLNSNIEHALSSKVNIAGGVKVTHQQNENYRQLVDLMGADFFLNTYQFLNPLNAGNQNYAQNDLNNPNRLVKEGDKYGYDYILRNTQSEAWAQTVVVLKHIDAFASVGGGYTAFNREGLMRNGLFANNSFGTSDTHGFVTGRAKGGVTYKIDRHHAVYANASITSDAPLMANTYISAQTRDFVINDPTNVKTTMAEMGYVLKGRKLMGRISGYAAEVKDLTTIRRFFYDEVGTQAFVSYIMNKVNTRSTGVEFAATCKLTNEWTVTAVAAMGQYYYTNNPMVNIYADNDPTVKTTAHQVYIQNYYVGNTGPQSVYTMAVNYRPGKWNATINFNYMDRNYIDIYPERRTASAVDMVVKGSDTWKAIVDQERMPGAFTTDLYVSRSIGTRWITKKLHRKSTSLFASLGITNLLDKRDIKIAGYEQLRYDFTNRTPGKFQSFYDYAFGANFSANISFRF